MKYRDTARNQRSTAIFRCVRRAKSLRLKDDGFELIGEIDDVQHSENAQARTDSKVIHLER